MFMYPPAFDFSKGGEGTVKYLSDVHDAACHKLYFESDWPSLRTWKSEVRAA